MKPLAVGLLLAGRRVAVVGAGPVALAKVGRLLAAEARVVVIAPKAVPALAAAAASGSVEWREKPFAAEDLAGMWLCLTATGLPDVDAAVFAACEARRIPCNAADVPESCHFFLLAQVSDGPLTLAVGTAGTAPGLARRLAEEARAAWPPDAGHLATRYAQIRRWLQRSQPGPGHAALRAKVLRWLAAEPWDVLRQPLPTLRAAVQARWRDMATEAPSSES